MRPRGFARHALPALLALLPVAWLVLGPWALAWAAVLLAVRDVGGWVALRGPRHWFVALGLAPLRELLVLSAWAVAPFKQHVSWRGKRFRLGAGTLLYFEPKRATAAANGHARLAVAN